MACAHLAGLQRCPCHTEAVKVQTAEREEDRSFPPLHARFGDRSWADSTTHNGESWLSGTSEDKARWPICVEDLAPHLRCSAYRLGNSFSLLGLV